MIVDFNEWVSMMVDNGQEISPKSAWEYWEKKVVEVRASRTLTESDKFNLDYKQLMRDTCDQLKTEIINNSFKMAILEDRPVKNTLHDSMVIASMMIIDQRK